MNDTVLMDLPQHHTGDLISIVLKAHTASDNIHTTQKTKKNPTQSFIYLC